MAPNASDNNKVKDTKGYKSDQVIPSNEIPSVTLVSSRTLNTISAIVQENKCKSDNILGMFYGHEDNKMCKDPDAESYTSSCTSENDTSIKPAVMPQVGFTFSFV